MNKNLQRLAGRYTATLKKYLTDERESLLEQAYELGRTAIAGQLGILDMVRIHMEALKKSGVPLTGNEVIGRRAKSADIFFQQSLSPFEATHRGFRETNLKLEERNRALESEVAEHERAEQALRESKQRYSMLIETANDVIFSLAPDGRIAAVNHAFEVITGWRRTAWLGKSFAQLIHPDDLDIAMERFYAILHGMPPEQWVYRVQKANGQYAVGEFTLTQEIKDGQCVGIFGIGRDITERKKTENALRESEERFRLMVGAVKDYLICMLDPALHVASWNQGAKRITGYDAGEIVGRSLSTFYPPEDIVSGELQRTLQKLRRTGQIEVEGWRVRKDGSRFLVSAILTAIRDDTGKLRGFVKVARDVTERRQAEDALRQSRERYKELFQQATSVQEKLRRLSKRMLQMQEDERKRISRELHDEVGQALTAISVNLAAMKNNGNGRNTMADIQQLLRETMETVHRFAIDLRPAMLDELGLLPALRSHVSRFAERTGLRVVLRANPIAEKLGGEKRTVLFRIAQESLNNVAKHAQASHVEMVVRKKGDAVLMEITDNGKSFQEDMVNHARHRQRLGLLGMQERARLVNGEFMIRPRPGKGTTVRVLIPFKSGAPAVLRPPVRGNLVQKPRPVRAQIQSVRLNVQS